MPGVYNDPDCPGALRHDVRIRLDELVSEFCNQGVDWADVIEAVKAAAGDLGD